MSQFSYSFEIFKYPGNVHLSAKLAQIVYFTYFQDFSQKWKTNKFDESQHHSYPVLPYFMELVYSRRNNSLNQSWFGNWFIELESRKNERDQASF